MQYKWTYVFERKIPLEQVQTVLDNVENHEGEIVNISYLPPLPNDMKPGDYTAVILWRY